MESGLPPIPLLISQRQRIAALRVVCSPPEVNPAKAGLHSSFPSLSNDQAQDSSTALTKGLTSVYLPLNWQTPRPVPPMRNHLLIDAVAHKIIPFTHGVSRMPMINCHLVSLALAVPPQPLMDNTYSALKKRVREALLEEWSVLFPTPGFYLHRPALTRAPSWDWASCWPDGFIRGEPGKATWPPIPPGGPPTPTPPAPAVVSSPSLSNMLSSLAAADKVLVHFYSTVSRASVRTLPNGPPSQCSKCSPHSSA